MHPPFSGVIHFLQHADRQQMRVLQQTVDIVHGHARDVGLVQAGHPNFCALRGHGLSHHAIKLVDVPRSRTNAGKTRVLFKQLPLTYQAQKFLPMPVGVNQHAQMAIAGGVGAALLHQQARVAGLAQRWLEGGTGHVLAQNILRHGLEHGHFHRLAYTRLVARNHRRQDGIGRHQAHRAVGKGQGHITRLAATGAAHQAGYSRCTLNQVVVSRLSCIRPLLAVAIQACINDARIDGLEPLVIDAQALHGLRPDVVDHHIGRLHQLEKSIQALRLFEVQHQTAFVAVDVQKNRAHARVTHGTNAAHRIPGRRLDLDHVRPHVGHELRGKGPHQHTGQIQYTQSIQRTRHAVLP